jgi:hypothetical protein
MMGRIFELRWSCCCRWNLVVRRLEQMEQDQLQEQVPDMSFVMVVVGLAGELVAGTEAETEAAVKMQVEDKNFEVRM